MRCSPRIQFASFWCSTSPSSTTRPSIASLPSTTGAAAAASPKSNFQQKKTLTRIKNTSPPPSLGIGQARGGYVASLLLDWLGLTRDLSCCVYVMFILNFLFLYTEYIEFHTHTHTFILWRLIVAKVVTPRQKRTNRG